MLFQSVPVVQRCVVNALGSLSIAVATDSKPATCCSTCCRVQGWLRLFLPPLTSMTPISAVLLLHIMPRTNLQWVLVCVPQGRGHVA